MASQRRKKSPSRGIAGSRSTATQSAPGTVLRAQSPAADFSPDDEVIYEGIGVSPGIAIGPAHPRESGAVDIPEYSIAANKLSSEVLRFHQAVKRATGELTAIKRKIKRFPEAAAEEMGYLLDARLNMLSGSRLIRGIEARITQKAMNAEAAVQAQISETAQSFMEMKDPYLAARIDDVREIGARLVRCLTDTPPPAFATLPKGALVIADELTPADTVLLDPKMVGGFAAVFGGPESHTAIMARSLMLPAVLGIPAEVLKIKSGTPVILDGEAGRLILRPTAATLHQYRQNQATLRKAERELKRLRKLEPRSRDGVRIGLYANIELPREAENIGVASADGIGLVRSEFLFMNRQDLPSEDEQYEAFSGIVQAMNGRPVTIRTIDVGGEKLATPLRGQLGQSVNPALGLRAIRLSLKYPRLFEAQLAAIIRAGEHGPVRILLPMISSVSEIRESRRIYDKVLRRLKRARVTIKTPPPLGIMVETPGAALSADSLAPFCDFFAIGTNDLTMYTLAIDRGEEQVAHLYNPLHPAILRLIQFIGQAAWQSGIPVSVCGEIAGDARMTALMIGLGIHDLSMSSGNLLKVKKRVRDTNTQDARRMAQEIVREVDPARISDILDTYNAGHH